MYISRKLASMVHLLKVLGAKSTGSLVPQKRGLEIIWLWCWITFRVKKEGIKGGFNLAERRASSALSRNKRSYLRAGDLEDGAIRSDGVGAPGSLGSPWTTDGHRVTNGARRRLAGDIFSFPPGNICCWGSKGPGLSSEAQKHLCHPVSPCPFWSIMLEHPCSNCLHQKLAPSPAEHQN